MNDGIKQKIDKYVNNASTAAQLKANEEAQTEISNVRAKLSSKGGLLSSALDHEMIRIESARNSADFWAVCIAQSLCNRNVARLAARPESRVVATSGYARRNLGERGLI